MEVAVGKRFPRINPGSLSLNSSAPGRCLSKERTPNIEDVLRGGDGRRGIPRRIHTPVRGTVFFGSGVVTPGPARECDITVFVKGRRTNQISFEPGFGAYQGLAQKIKVPLSEVFCLFLQF